MDPTQIAFRSIAGARGEPPAVPERPGLCFMADVVQYAANGPRFVVAGKNLGAVSVACAHGADRLSLIRGRRHLADGRDLITVIISKGGRFLLEDAHGNGHFGPNGAAILESRRESALHKLDGGPGIWSTCIERAALEPLLAGLHAPPQRCLQPGNPGLRLLDGYLDALFTLGRNHDATLAATHIRDLVLSALGVSGDALQLVREGGIHAARQSAVLDTIRRRAGEPGLTPADVARQSGISVRYLHHLLEATGKTFSQHLLEQRLQRALAELRDPRRRLKIAAIASASGFSDISHFNRSFRRAFGDTPHGVRVRSARTERRELLGPGRVIAANCAN